MNKTTEKIYRLLPSMLRNQWDRISNSDIGRRMAFGAFWSLAGSIIAQGLMLLATIVVARILGKTEFGELGMIRSTVNMFAVFAGFGLGLTATKYIAEFRHSKPQKTGKIIGLTTLFAAATGGIISVIIIIAAPYIAEHSINAPQLTNEIRIGAVMLFFSALNGAQTGTLSGFEAFKSIAKVNLISGVLAFPIQIGCTYLLGLQGAVIGFGLNFLIMWVLNFFTMRRVVAKAGIKIQFKGAWDEWPVLWKFSLPALLSGILVAPVMWACNALLVNKPDGYGEMAVFDAANQWRNAILFIPAILSQIALPLLSAHVGNKIQFRRILLVNIKLNATISFFVAGVVSLLSIFIMKSYGSGFSNGYVVLIILSFSSVLVAINNIIGQAIASKGKMWAGFMLNLIWSIALLGFTYYFLNKGFGSMGIALALLFSYSIHTITQSFFIYFNLKNQSAANTENRKKMLYIMHVSWYWIKQRPHFLAINLSEYFNTTILYPMSVRYWRNKKTTPENCMAIPQFPLSRFSIIKKLNIQLYRFSTKRKLKNCDIVWFGNPDDFVFVSDLIPSKVYVIYDCMDDLCEFPGSTAKSIANTILYESKLIERANLLIASSRKLALVLESRYKTHKPIKIVNNGIDSEFIAQQQTSEIINYPQKLNHKDLMYIGTISEWFNFPLLIDALQIHPELRLILIGPKCSIIPEHERIIHLGTQPHKLLPVFMNRADALIMPFVVNELILAVNPVKLYEYLTTDKPIITCYYPEIAPFGNLVYSYSSENDFQILIGKLINSTLKAESDEMRIAFLNANTWQQRVRGIADLIDK